MQIKESYKFLIETVAVILIVILVISYISYYKINDLKDANRAEKTTVNLVKLRVALEEYYKVTGTYPDLTKESVWNDLSLLDYENEAGIKVSFAKIYGKNKIYSTETTKKIKGNNEIYDISDFEAGSMNGGWNYNFKEKTGEIHANLPESAYGQNIIWSKE
ncbi:MAG: hypothetical protein ACRC0S_00740 [Fusobacteriaceae bacterium]